MNKRGEGMERVHSRDSETSFIEIVVSVFILGTVCIGVLNAIATAAVEATPALVLSHRCRHELGDRLQPRRQHQPKPSTNTSTKSGRAQ